MNRKHIVILADGTFPKTAYPLSLLHNADVIICCDGAVVKLIQNTELKADYIVGDMDTLDDDKKYKEAYLPTRRYCAFRRVCDAGRLQ